MTFKEKKMKEDYSLRIFPVRETVDGILPDLMEFLWGIRPKSVDRLYSTHDSIMEIPEFYCLATVPRSVALQMETHKKKHGFYLWMASARPDRDPEAAKSYSRTQPVRIAFKFTARGIADIAHFRLCGKAEAPTRRFMALLKEAIREAGFQALADQMVPLCEYRGGICTELKSCGRNLTYAGRGCIVDAEPKGRDHAR